MGGYGSGGLNKTHGRVENYRFQKLDSFAFYEYLRGDKYLHYKTDVKYPISGHGIIYHVKTKTASIDYDGYQCPLGFARVPNIDGITMRMYFLCPECARRVRYLYKKDGGYQCRIGTNTAPRAVFLSPSQIRVRFSSPMLLRNTFSTP